jgi:Leucine-rich repeat (LRR) protein
LNKELAVLDVSKNLLTSLPTLNEELAVLYCSHNRLTRLPSMNKKLHTVHCLENKLYSLPDLNDTINQFCFVHNPIYEIIAMEELPFIKSKIKVLNQFRHLYYCIKLRKQFKSWLWEKVRNPKIMKKYHPRYLIENIEKETNLFEFLEKW